MSNKHSSEFFSLEHRGLWETLTFPLGFTAVLCWWVAIIGITHTRSSGSMVFLLVPVLATAATLVALRSVSRTRAGNSRP